MKNYFTAVLLLSNLFAFESIVIIDIYSNSVDRYFSRSLTQGLISEIKALEVYQVLDYFAIMDTLEGQGFQYSNCSDENCASDIGNKMGVGYVIFGTVEKFGTIYSVNVNMLNLLNNKIEKNALYSYKGNDVFPISSAVISLSKQLFKLPEPARLVNGTIVQSENQDEEIMIAVTEEIQNLDIDKGNKFSIIGLGIYGNFDLLNYPSHTYIDGNFSVDYPGFKNSLGVGALFYIDAIPVIDIEADIELVGNTYKFTPIIRSKIKTTGELPWGRASAYVTIRKEIWGWLSNRYFKTQVYGGAGINKHIVMPVMTIDLWESAFESIGIKDKLDEEGLENGMGGLLEDDAIQKEFVKFLLDNAATPWGFHLQAGARGKLLILDISLNARYSIVKNVILDKSSFPSVWLGLALSI